MNGKAKRIIAVMVFLLTASLLFAGGKSESTTSGGTTTKGVQESVTSDSKQSVLSLVMANVGNTLSRITASVALGLHPFPEVLLNFYNFSNIGTEKTVIAYANDFDTARDLVVSTGLAGKSSKIGENDVDLVSENVDGKSYNAYQVKIGNRNEILNWSENSNKRFPVVAMLFGLLLAAEIVFTAVFGYVMPEQEGQSLFRMIAVKVAKALVLFVLAASLPFLIEAVRYGLFKIAEMYQDPAIEIDSMFEMPQIFMSRMANLINTVGWRNDAEPLFSIGQTAFGQAIFQTLGRLLAGLVYIVFQFVLCIELFKTGMHIVMNIIEVYLLLTVVILLLPFTIFTPTKNLVQGCTQTLFMNLIECFVIMLMIIMVVPACERAMDALYGLTSGLTAAVSKVSIESTMTTERFKDATDATIDFRFDFSTMEQTIVLACTYTSYYKDLDGKYHSVTGGAFSCMYMPYDVLSGEYLPQDDAINTLTSTYIEAGYKEFNWNRDLAGSEEDSGNETFGSYRYVTNIPTGKMKEFTIEEFCAEAVKNILIRGRRTIAGGLAFIGDNDKWIEGFVEIAEGVGIAVVSGFVIGISIATGGLAAIVIGSAIGLGGGVLAAKTTQVGVDTLDKYDLEKAMSNPETAGEADCIGVLMGANSKTTWRSLMTSALREQQATLMMNEQASESSETSMSNETLVADLIIAWILVMLPCYFIKQSSQITNGLRSGYVGFESFANSTSHALQSMGRGMGAMVSLVSKGIGMMSKGVEQSNARHANAQTPTPAANMRKGDNMNSSDS